MRKKTAKKLPKGKKVIKFSLPWQRKEENVLKVKAVVETEEAAHPGDKDDSDADFIVPEKTESDQMVTAALVGDLEEHKLDQYLQLTLGNTLGLKLLWKRSRTGQF